MILSLIVGWRRVRMAGLLPLISVALLGCESTLPVLPKPLKSIGEIAASAAPGFGTLANTQNTNPNAQTTATAMPRVPAATAISNPGPVLAQTLSSASDVADISLNLEQLPLPSFIRLVYGEILKKNVQVDETIAKRADLVTLRSGGAQTKSQVERAAQMLLKSYGISVVDVGGLIRVLPEAGNLGYLPEIRRGAALPESPLPLRPQFHLIELASVRNTDVAGWLKTMFGTRVNLQEDTSRNAVLISGTPDNVAAAIEAIRVLDQPVMQGRGSLRLTPRLWSVDELAKRLFEVLSAEGYSVNPLNQSPGAGMRYPITLLPVPTVNSLLVFSQSDVVLKHVEEWAKTLEEAARTSPAQGYFTYQVQYKDAAEIATTLDKLRGGKSNTTTGQAGQAITAASGGAAQNAAARPGSASGTTAGQAAGVIVDESNNMLIFEGSEENYLKLRSLVQTLDRPSRSVVIEVTVAEVALTDKFQLGVEWGLKNLNSDGSGVTASTFGGTGIGSAGLNLRFLDVAGDLRALVNALASTNQASILSSPRLMARNNETATIQVGQEVPIITSQQSTLGATGAVNQTGIIQTVQYRNTGVILKIKPVIFSSDQISVEIAQEVSAAQTTNTGVSNSPTFGTRKVETKLTLKNGSTILLGGLISTSGDTGDAGIPFLKDIPLLGQAFRTNTRNNVKTELIVLITPYIVNDDYEARSLTNAFKGMLGPWAAEDKLTPSKAGEITGKERSLLPGNGPSK